MAVDESGSFQIIYLYSQPTEPNDLTEGRLWYDTTNEILKASNGTSYQEVTNPPNIAQVVTFETSEWATGTTTTPFDDTIPQNTEGTEFLTCAITPTSATNDLIITVNALVGSSQIRGGVTGALFQDDTADAIATSNDAEPVAGQIKTFTMVHRMTAGTTSETTFKFRIGADASSTISLNGTASARIYGGTATSSITIMEVTT